MVSLWARSAGIALAFTVLASVLLWTAPAWSQSVSTPVVTFAAVTTDTTTEGGADIELRIGLPQEHVSLSVEIELTGLGTALAGSDYTLVGADSAPGIILGDGAALPLTLSVGLVTGAQLRLLLRPRGDDRISQGYRFLNLRISGYRVVSESAGGTVDLPPALNFTIRDDDPLSVQQLQYSSLFGDFACVILGDGSVRCVSDNQDDRATLPKDLPPVVQLAVAGQHVCAVTVLGRVRCWGLNDVGQSSPPKNLRGVAQLGLGRNHNCALTALGAVHCWGANGYGFFHAPDGRATPPVDLPPVVQIGVGSAHSCALTVGGAVRCWGANGPGFGQGEDGRATPPVDLPPVVQISVGEFHSCALTVGGGVRCWGFDGSNRDRPPADLEPVAQLALGRDHSCALTVSGQVRCWGSGADGAGDGRATPPVDLPPVVQISVGESHSCALTLTGQLHCWGDVGDFSSLPPGAVTTADDSGRCALLADSSVYCPGDAISFPSELATGDVVMGVWPRQLKSGERAAIRFANLRETTQVFTARFEVFGDGAAEPGRDYQLLSSTGTLLVAEPNGSYEIVVVAGSPPSSGDPPATSGESPPPAWLESLVDNKSLFLYVRPLELLLNDDSELSIHDVAQPVELIATSTATATLAMLRVSVSAGNVLQLPAGTDTITVDVRVDVLDVRGLPVAVAGLPIAATGLLLVAELLTGSARDWSPNVDSPEALSATDETGVFDGRLTVALDEDDTSVELRIGVIGFTEAEGIIIDAAVVQVLQSLSFVAAASSTTEGAAGVELQIGVPQGHVGMPVEIDLNLAGTAQYDSDYTLVSLETTGSVSIDETASDVTLSLAAVPGTPLRLLLQPRANDAIRQGDRRAELRISGYRVAGVARDADALPTALGVTILDRYLPVMQRLLGVASGAACALLDEQDLRCWYVAATAAELLRTVLDADDILSARQLAFGEQHVCWLQQDRQVVCGGSDSGGQATVPDDLSTTSTVAVVAGREGSCAVDQNGAVRCWGRNGDEQSALPVDLNPVMQLSLGDGHGCALHADGVVRCWGDNAGNAGDKATPPDDLAPVLQLALGYEHSCALQRDGQVRCWGANMPPDDLGPAMQLTSGANHSCALLADGAVRCWGASDSDQLSIPSLPPGGVKSLVAGGNSSCALLADGSVRCWGGGLESAVPAELRVDDVAVSVLPQRLLVGQRAAIRFADLRGEREAPAVRIELLDDTAQFGIDYRLLDAAGQPVSAAPDGRYLLAGNMQPAAYIESLPDAQGRPLRTLYVLPLETVPADGAAPSLRRAAQPVELTTATATLARLRVSVPAGNVLQLPAGTDTITVDVRVDALDATGLPIDATGLLLVAELSTGSARSWLPSMAMPAALSATGETGVFEGRLTVALDEDDTAAGLSIGVIGFTEGEGVIVEPAVVRVLQLLSFVAAASTTTEGAAGVELQIGVPQGYVGMPVEIDLNLAGTALLGTDYTLISIEAPPGSVSIDETASGVTLRLAAVPDTPLILLLLPRPNDIIRQGDRRAELLLSGYRVAGVARSAAALPTTLGVTILDPYLPVRQRLLGVASGAACVLLDEQDDELVELRCWSVAAAAELRTVLAADDILGARQLAFGEQHVCWLQQDRQVVCDGSDSGGQATVPDDLSTTSTVAVVAGREGSCAVDQNGALRCWGRNGDEQSALPADLNPVMQLSLGDGHGCALHADGGVSCWGDNAGNAGDKATPPDNLAPVVRLALGYEHSCALQRDGQVRCWGTNMPPDDLGPATQLTSGANHSCALLADGAVRCWGASDSDQLSIPSLPPGGVKSLVAGGNSSCALLAEGSVRCWGGGLENAVPAELRAGDVVVSVLPQRLPAGERAAIRFADLRGEREAPAVRIELLDDTARFGSDYRLLDAAGQPVSATPDGRYLLAGDIQPAAYIESLPDAQGRPLRTLYVLPLETVPADGAAPSLRRAAQPVELTTATATLARLRVSVPAGNVLQLPAGTDTITVDVRVDALDARGLPIAATGLLLVAELSTGSARSWLPSMAMPAALSATGETGVFEGRLTVALDEDDTAAGLSIGVIGFAEGEGIIVETAVVRVLQSLSFVAAASTTTEGAAGVELQIGVPQGHVGMPVEIDLNLAGTAQYDSDYTLVSRETLGSVSIDETASGVTLRLAAVPDTPLILLLLPRANDVIRQGDRRAELLLSGYRVAGVARSAAALPTTLGVTILDPYLPVRQRLLGVASGAACVLLDEQDDELVELRCWSVAAAAELRTVLAADDILGARQLAFGEQHVCWLQQDRQVVCDGSDSGGQATVPDDLSTTSTVAVVAGREGSCAVDQNGALRCWGRNGDEQSALPADLNPVMQLSLGDGHGCALHADGGVSCWGDNAGNAGDKATPPDNLAPVVRLALGYEHSCALQRDGQVRCWGTNMPPDDLGPAMQLTSGANHSCALLADGAVRCWGANDFDQLSIPSLPLGGVKSLVAGGNSSCALLAEGSVRCWGGGLENGVPAELQPGDVAVSVLPQRLPAGQRAAIRFADLRGEREAPAVRIELLDDTARFGSDYRLLDAAGQPVSATPDGRYLLAGDIQPAAYIEALPDAQGRPLRTLYVLPLETVPTAGSAPSLRRAAQPVELIVTATTTTTATLARLRVSVPAGNVLQLPAGTDTITVDVRVAALDATGLPIAATGLLLVAELSTGSASYWLPSVASPAALSATDGTGVFEGRLTVALDEDDAAVELRVGVIGFAEGEGIIVETAVVRVLQSLSFVAAATTTTEGATGVELQIGVPQGHVGLAVEIDLNIAGTALLGTDYTLVSLETSGSVSIDKAASGVTLRLAAVPDTPLMLLLRPRPNDIIRQGDRRAELLLSGYRVAGVARDAAALPTTLGVTILDPYLPVRQRLLGVASGAACVLLDEDNEDLVELRCWTVAAAATELRTVLAADDILSARQLAFGEQHVCWLQQDRQVVCAGSDSSGQTNVPADLSTTSTVAVVAGRVESCAVDEDGAVRCWGEQSALPEDLSPVMQLSLGDGHGCALHADGAVSCWGDNTNGQSTVPDDLAPVAQLALGYEHSCALQRDGQVRCWGTNMPPVDLGPATQLTSGANHSCALLADGAVRCWGANDSGQLNIPSLPLGGVKSLVAGGNSSCALLAEGSVRCWGFSGLENAVPAELQPDDVTVSVLPQRLLVGERAAIRFADLRETTAAFSVRIELLDDTAQFGSDYRLLDAAGEPLSAAPDGRYLLAGDTQPAAYIESLLDPQELRTLYVLPLETVPTAGSAPSLRRAAQPVELIVTATTTTTATLARLRVSVPAGNVLQLPAGTDTITVDVRVAALDATGLPIAATGLLLVADLSTGSASYWLPSVASPAALSATDGTGVFEGRLTVALDEDDTAVELRVGVIGFAEGEGVIVEPAVVRVLQLLSFVAAATTTTEGAAGVELQIGVPQGHVGMPVEIDLNLAGTALLGTDYTLVSLETLGSVSIDETASGVTMRLAAVPDTQLMLLLRPRANDIIRQGDRRAELLLSGYRVAGVARDADALPTTLGVTILDRYLPVRQRLLGVASGAACVLLDEDNEDLVELRCWTVAAAATELRTVLAADDILSARQLAFGEQHVCWLQQDRQVVCAGSDSSGQTNVPADLSTTSTVAVVAGRVESCAVDEDGAVRCWGEQSALPEDLSPVMQLSLGDGHGCALHADGEVSCWGDNAGNAGDKATPPDNLGPVLRLALGYEHSCALQRDGQVRCWGTNMPPVDLGPAMQLTSGANHSCALLADGAVRCWGANDFDQLSIPSLPLGGVKSLVAGGNSSCALLAEGSVRCWGFSGLENAVPAELQPDDVTVSVLPQRLLVGERAAIRFADLRETTAAFSVRIELLDDTAQFGSDYRLLDAAGEPLSAAPDGRYLLAGDTQPAAYIESLLDPQELRTLYVLPLETVPAAGSALSLRRAAQPVELTTAPALARLHVSVPAGNVLQLPAQGTDTITVDVRVAALDAMGLPTVATDLLLVAERIAGSARSWSPSVAMPAALSATGETGVFEGRLTVALDEDDAAVELRVGVIGFAQGEGVIVDTAVVQVLPALSFIAAASMITEGADGVELQIRVPQEHVGSRVEIELTAGGTAMAGSDYTLDAAEPAQGIILGDGSNSTITLRVDPAPAEPLRLLLRPRGDDLISQGQRLLNLRISGYRVVPESAGTVDLPPALDLTIVDDDPLTVQQVQLVPFSGTFACVRLSDGSLRCMGRNVNGRTTPPDDLGPATQLGLGSIHACVLTVSGRVRCWGSNENGRATPPADLDQVVQLAVASRHNCALTALGTVHCWGDDSAGQATPPADLGPVAEIALNQFHSCAVTVGGQVRCWGANGASHVRPPAGLNQVVEIGLGNFYSCARTMSGQVRCWGGNNDQFSPPSDLGPGRALGPAAQLAVGAGHTCALTISGQVRCWGENRRGQSDPPAGLAPAAQLAVGNNHSCAWTLQGKLHCWGFVINVSSLPPGMVTAVDTSGSCALLVDGSLYCPSRSTVFPSELHYGNGLMSVWPRQLLPGERAAIRFASLRNSGAFTAQFEVFGDGAAEPGRDYRLWDSDSGGQPLEAEEDGSYLIEAGLAPMAWLEILVDDRDLLLYVRPLELRLNDGSELSIRNVVQPVELALSAKLVVQIPGGAKQLLTADNMTPILLRLSLTDLDGSPLDEPSVLTVRLQGMLSADDAMVVPAGPFEVTVSDAAAVTAEVMVILGAAEETTLHFTVSGQPPDVIVDLPPTALRITLVSAPLDLDVTEDDSVGTEDVILLIQFMSAGRSGILPLALEQRLEDLMPPDVVDLRLDLDGNNTVDMTDLRIILRHLAGLRGAALGEGVQQEQVEALFQPQQVLQPSP